jgi:hypothetical protein
MNVKNSLPLKKVLTRCLETPVQNYYSVLRNIQEGRRSPLYGGGRLKSRRFLLLKSIPFSKMLSSEELFCCVAVLAVYIIIK